LRAGCSSTCLRWSGFFDRTPWPADDARAERRGGVSEAFHQRLFAVWPTWSRWPRFAIMLWMDWRLAGTFAIVPVLFAWPATSACARATPIARCGRRLATQRLLQESIQAWR